MQGDLYGVTVECPVGSQGWITGAGGSFPVQNGSFRILQNMAPDGTASRGATFAADIPGTFTSETTAEGLLKSSVATFTGAGLTTQVCADPNITWAGHREVALPVCAIEMSQASYVNGDTVTAQVARLANPDTGPVSVEVGLWIEGPGFSPVPFTKVGADGSMRLSPGFDQNFGPIVVGHVTPSLPRGTYAFNCRIVDPVTLRLLAEDLNPFDIR